MATMTAKKAFGEITQHAEAIRNNAMQRFPEAASPGDAVAQGDIAFVLLESVPSGVVLIDNPSPQLAPGTTQGSRHILDSLDGVTMYRLGNATALDGPVLKLDRERVVTHPEHGHWTLPPGVYGVVYQRQYADDLRRVED